MPKPQPLRVLVPLAVLSLLSCSPRPREIEFHSGHEVSGQKIALRDIAPDLPEDWEPYNFVILEYMISTPQRFQVGFTTKTGYAEMRVMSYTPGGWNRLAIPLDFYRKEPAARSDLAATYNQPRQTGWINLTGQRRELRGVDSIGFRMQAPIGNPWLKIRSVELSVDDPGDRYLGKEPVVDEFGQYNLGDWEGKVQILDQLQEEWRIEDGLVVDRERFGYAPYGGYLSDRFDGGTGFFRTECIDGVWWFVDPEGYLFLSHGVNCVSPGGGGQVTRLHGRENLYKTLPPSKAGEEDRTPSFGRWNLERRYGEDYMKPAVDNILTRMDRWGLNTIANWSSPAVYERKSKAYTLQLRGIGIEGDLMGLADVYDPDFARSVDAAVAHTVEPVRDDPWLLGYFTFNEPSFLGREVHLCELILAGPDRPIRDALREHLNAEDTDELRKEFIHATFRRFLTAVHGSLKSHDPNHLTLGIRFGQEAEEEILLMCKDVFDVFSFNCYDAYPRTEMLDRFALVTGKPLLIGEYHFGTVDRGMAQSLWQVDNQEERGVAYRHYTERAYAHPALVGTSYFQWCDQDLTGRNMDGENYNCGLIDVTDRPYPWMAKAVAETASRIRDIHRGVLPPTDKAPQRTRGHHAIPDVWNE
ncbi:MAG: hypothetical protein R2751_08745 [Bacteroidales bacterium]